MKYKSLCIAAAVALLCACDGGQRQSALQQQVDSLTQVSNQKDAEINEMLSQLNAVADGFRKINEAQGRVTVARGGEGANAEARIREEMDFIHQTMLDNAETISRLKQRLGTTSVRSEQLSKTIENLTAELQQKSAEIETLRQELETKNIHIARLDEQIADLGRTNDDLRNDNASKDETISRQDEQINQAWYVFGTKSELKAHNILKDGKVLQQSFDASYFTKIDIRDVTSIPLYSKNAEMLTSHPKASYKLERDASKQYVLYIEDPDQFWSTSKYLVIQVK